MSYSLNINFTTDILKILYTTGTNVVIAKPSSANTDPNVAWQVFKPMQVNMITWDEDYGIYASTSQIQDGATLTKLSRVDRPAAIGKLYTLQPDATFSVPQDGGTSGSYSVLNKYNSQPYMTVGLFQKANVNGTDILDNAISASGVLLNSTAVMTPFTTVYIWLQSGVKSNSVVTQVTSPKTEVKFGGSVTSQTVIYDPSTGMFIPAGCRNADNVTSTNPSL